MTAQDDTPIFTATTRAIGSPSPTPSMVIVSGGMAHAIGRDCPDRIGGESLPTQPHNHDGPYCGTCFEGTL